MSKTAFVFPGQGAQYVGMGKDFYDTYPEARQVFELAESVSGMDMKALIFEENENLDITKYTQVAMLTVELAILRVLKSKGVTADVTAGLSLGEYAAVVASGALSEEDALRLVVKRGAYMQEAVPTGGAMTAVMGLDNDTITQICEDTPGIVSVANYNCPGQTVITGEQTAVDAAAISLKEAGARKCTPLKVSGPFHSAMLIPAGEKLAKELEPVVLRPIETAYVSNVTAGYVTDATQIKDLLQKQISSSVKWQQSVEQMLADGVDTFIEIGPKKTLTSFLKKIDKEAKGYRVDTCENMDKLLEDIKC